MKADIFKVEEWMNEYEKYCKYDLGNTTVQTLSLDGLFALSGENREHFFNELCSKTLGYGWIKGNPDLKKGISSLYKGITESNIIPTIGAAGANHLVFYSLVEPSDTVVSVIPVYQQLYSIPRSFNADVRLLHLKKENDFLPDLDELKKIVTPNTKLICINNPNNPTGKIIPEDVLYKITEIADTYGAYVLCDEVYRGLVRSDEEIPSIVDIYDKGISVCSMSKIFSLAGLRLGWVASGNDDVIDSCFHHREYNMISCSVVDEMLAALALKNANLIVERNRKVIKESFEVVNDWIKKQAHFTWIPPDGGTTALIYYDFDINSFDFCHKLAVEYGVFVTPGDCFEEEKCFRIGYCTGVEGLRFGLEEIERFSKTL